MHGNPSRFTCALMSLQMGGAVSVSTAATQGCDDPALRVSPVSVLNSTAASDVLHEDRELCLVSDGNATVIAIWSTIGAFGDDVDILFARSTDHGQTWSTAATLNANAAGDTAQDTMPALAHNGAGTWIAVWKSEDAMGGTLGTDGDILFTRSIDKGVTWSIPAPLNTNATVDDGDDELPRIAADGNGNWVAVWSSNDGLDGVLGKDFDILVAHSGDNALTWSAPAALDQLAGGDGANDNDVKPAVAHDGNDTWLATWMSEVGARTAHSNDNGRTWSSSTLVEPGAVPRDPDVASVGGGIWLVAATKSEGDRDIFVYRSADAGQTWSSPIRPVADDVLAPFEDRLARLAVGPSGLVTLVWESNELHGGAIGHDWDIMLCASTDSGLTWTLPVAPNQAAYDGVSEDRAPIATPGAQDSWIVGWQSNNSISGTIGVDFDLLVSRTQVFDFIDCNGNLAHDACDILDGTNGDLNLDGVPDDCEAPPYSSARLSLVLQEGDSSPVGSPITTLSSTVSKFAADWFVFRASVAGSNPNMIALNDETSSSVVVRQGDAAPGTPEGVNFSSTLEVLAVNTQRDVLVSANLTGPGVTLGNKSGIWLQWREGLEYVARKGDHAAGTAAGTVFATLGSKPRLNDGAKVAFDATLSGGGATDTNNSGLWVWQNGVQQLLVRRGQTASGTASTFQTFNRFDLDAAGNLYFGATLANPGSPAGIWRATAPGKIDSIVVPGQQAPGMAEGITFTTASFRFVAPNGRVLFTASLNGPGVNPNNDGTTWAYANGLFTLITRQGDQVPGLPAGQYFDFTSPLALSDDGRAVLVGGIDGPNTSGSALWAETPNGLTVVARSGSPAPGALPPAVLGFSSSSTHAAINDVGDVLFSDSVTAGLGVWGWRASIGLFYVGVAGGEVIIDDLPPQPLLLATLPITGSASSESWNLTNEGAFLIEAVPLQGSRSPRAVLRGTVPLLGDLNGDGHVNVDDLMTVILRWGPCEVVACAGDVNRDGAVDVDDLVLVILNWTT
jgi:hypothetical protein